jgi:RHS repeat-associated protein
LYDLSGNQVAEISAAGVYNRGELYIGTRHLATYTSGPNGTTYFTHRDWLATERARTDMTGAPCETITSLPFGDGQAVTSTCPEGDVSPMHFTGDQRDSESNLDHTQFRQYSSSIGGWMHPDPAGLAAADPSNPQSWNRYAYVTNNPLVLTDPSGLCPASIVEHRDIDNGDQPSGMGIPEPQIPSLGCGGWGGWGGGGVSIDGGGVFFPGSGDSGLSGLLGGSDANVPCPNKGCSGVDQNGNFVTFVAGAGGATGYLTFNQINQGLNEVNGTFLTNVQYTAYILSQFSGDIDAQQRALAAAIVANSGGKITYETAYSDLGRQRQKGYLQGGNFTFPTSFTPADISCGAKEDRCNGIHFPQAGFVHLDTSNPFSGPWALLKHAGVDILLGNVAYTVIPRPWP